MDGPHYPGLMKALSQFALWVILSWIAGCAQYEPMEAQAPVAIALAPVLNESSVAQLVAPVNRNVREGIAHSRHYQLVDASEAQVVLHLKIRSLRRRALARDPGDTGRPLSYHESVQVAVEWSGELPPPWGSDPVTVVEEDYILYSQPSLVSAEASAVAELADKLAGKILNRLNWPVTRPDR